MPGLVGIEFGLGQENILSS